MLFFAFALCFVLVVDDKAQVHTQHQFLVCSLYKSFFGLTFGLLLFSPFFGPLISFSHTASKRSSFYAMFDHVCGMAFSACCSGTLLLRD